MTKKFFLAVKILSQANVSGFLEAFEYKRYIWAVKLKINSFTVLYGGVFYRFLAFGQVRAVFDFSINLKNKIETIMVLIYFNPRPALVFFKYVNINDTMKCLILITAISFFQMCYLLTIFFSKACTLSVNLFPKKFIFTF